MKEWFEKLKQKLPELLKNKKVLIIGAVCLVLVIALIVGICLLTGGQEEAPAVEADYSLTVQTEDTTPLESVGVYVYSDPQKQDLVAFERTDAQGGVAWKGVADTTYTIVLNDLPEGVAAEESYQTTGTHTVLVLKAAEKTTVELGDNVSELVITDAQGNAYSVSQLLESKKVVVLNFWFATCGPCKAEFPHMQAAYEEYKDDVALFAMNPLDSDESVVEEVQEEIGVELTFPMFLCEEQWLNKFNLTAFPTTVVIDRTGTVSLIHVGSLPSQEIFERLFDFYTGENYVSVVAQKLTDVISLEAGEGTQENPLTVSGTAEAFEVTPETGKDIYCKLSNVTDMVLTLEHEDAYIIYNDKTYESEDGIVTVPFFVEDTDEVLLQIGIKEKEGDTASEEPRPLTVKLQLREGSESKPIELKEDVFATQALEGDPKGIHYTFKAKADGIFTVTSRSFPNNVDFEYILTNVTTEQTVKLSESEEENTVSVPVTKNDELLLIIKVEADGDEIPAATFTSDYAISNEEETVPDDGGETTPTDPSTGTTTPTTPTEPKPTYNTTPTGEAIETAGQSSIEVTVAPGELAYYKIYRLQGMYITTYESNAYIVMNGKLYEPRPGGRSFMVTSEDVPDNWTPTELCFGNAGTETITYTVYFSFEKGEYGNPYALELGTDFTTTQKRGNEQGVYYNWTATQSGTLTIKCNAAPAGFVYEYELYNRSAGTSAPVVVSNADADGNIVTELIQISIPVQQGQLIQLRISAVKDASGNTHPAATFTSIAYME